MIKRIIPGFTIKFHELKSNMRLFIISNRLPIKARKEKNDFIFSRSEGGLATGLDSLDTDLEKHWIGWPGVSVENEEEKKQLRECLSPQHYYPVFLTPQQIQEYYEGYSNSTIWPLCHYFFSYVQHENKCWTTYRQVNELFCETAMSLLTPDDIVWIQDYQLMLLPAMLRKQHPRISIGYFHHIPFPSYELFRILPEKMQLIKGLLGADLVAFHTEDYMRYFMIATQRISGINFSEGEVQLVNRIVHVDAFPMGINFSLYYNAPTTPEVQKFMHKIRQIQGNIKLILTVDRLDYSKGILQRLKGFTCFLEKYPEYHEKVSLSMVIVPSRSNVEKYADLKNRIDEMIGAVNGKYSTLNWTPIHYYYHSFPLDELVAFYHLADIALVTPLRDGMNLVAKEYIAAKRDRPGVLILSEMAGAALELPEALIINPNDTDEIENALYTALQMPEKEQLAKLRRMQNVISRQTVNKWATDFVFKLKDIRRKNDQLHQKLIETNNLLYICQAYQSSVHRLIILDYDGTLVGFTSDPQDSIPTPELNNLLTAMVSDGKNTVVICSGRDHETLEKWFGHLPLGLAAEHGAFLKEKGVWHEKLHREIWNEEIIRILRQFIDKTPGAMLEMKRTSLVWHYRNVNSWLGFVREQQLTEALKQPCQKLGLQIMRGNKIVEIKPPECTKGGVIRMLLKHGQYDFLMAIGDDVTDEDMFRAMPAEAFTIKIGNISGYARYNLYTQAQTLPFLQTLIGSTRGRR